jgi:hypothetical protein
MHDPSVVVCDLHVPIPRLAGQGHNNRPRNGIRRRRYTGGEAKGEPIYAWWRPAAWHVYFVGNRVKLVKLGTIWHDEPGGADSGSVCGCLPDGSTLSRRNLHWAWRHRKHCRFRLSLGMRTWRWLTQRCEGCGRRFGRKEARFGTGWESKGVMHEPCRTLRHIRAQHKDALEVAMGIANHTTRWRVERLIKDVREKFDTAVIEEALRD